MNHKKLFILSIGFLLLAPLLTAGSFEAESVKLNHCYALLSPVSENSDEASRMIETACFDSFSQAIYAATDGHVQLDPSIRPEDITDELLNRVEGTGTSVVQVVIGIDWDYANYGGSSYTWVVSETGCTPSIYYSVSSMPAGWNDRVSSEGLFQLQVLSLPGCQFWQALRNLQSQLRHDGRFR